MRVNLFGLDFDFDFRALFQLYLVAILIGQPVRHADLAIEMVRTLHRNLGFLRFTRTRMGLDHLFYFAWKRSRNLTIFG